VSGSPVTTDGVAVARDVLDRVIAHARADAPAECCGVLVGSGSLVSAAVRARNIAPAPTTTFLIEPADHFAALREARRRTLDIVGFYHSHPTTPAAPSSIDLDEASYPDHLYLIVSLAASSPDVRLYRLVAGAFVEIDFAVAGGI
jgi:proteasome lid subunit RPN8/RPN11